MKILKKTIATLFKIVIIFLPWRLKRVVYNQLYGFELDPKAFIGFSYIYPRKLVMGPGAEIGHLNVAIHLELIKMAKNTVISQQNWITGHPMNDESEFQDCPNRKAYLLMDEGSAISKKHHIDCTDIVSIGRYTSIGGYNTQILTHSTSLRLNKQMCAPITIGHNCFIGTRSVLLSGTTLPDCCVLGAGAVLQKSYTENYSLYGGVPARFIKKLDDSYTFLKRNYRSGQKIIDNE